MAEKKYKLAAKTPALTLLKFLATVLNGNPIFIRAILRCINSLSSPATI